MTQDALESPWPRLEIRLEPSQELLNRAHAGWERFIASLEETADD
ncbi:hypothetical protein [Streptomyces sp. NBC_00091]|nr:hypothetical protein [Streptomyces sp. NBC_00091]MCX5377656.1 hypothetical protein [Streptomyces sp. NBC_00091]